MCTVSTWPNPFCKLLPVVFKNIVNCWQLIMFLCARPTSPLQLTNQSSIIHAHLLTCRLWLTTAGFRDLQFFYTAVKLFTCFFSFPSKVKLKLWAWEKLHPLSVSQWEVITASRASSSSLLPWAALQGRCFLRLTASMFPTQRTEWHTEYMVFPPSVL